MPVTHSVSAVVDGIPNFQIPVSGSNLGPFRLSGYDISYTGFPLNFVDGDTIEIDVTTINGGITLNDLGLGLDEFLFNFNFPISDIPYDQPTDNPGGLPVMTYDRSTTVTVTNFTGNLVSNTIVSSFTGAQGFAPSLALASAGNYTNSSVTLTEFTIATTFTNIAFLPGFENYASFQSITATNTFLTGDEFEGVPVPGALALIGVGLLGFSALRRKA